MFERYVFVKLADADAADSARAELAEVARTHCAALGVLAVTVALPADAAARSAWDLALTLRFPTQAQDEAYRTSALHNELSERERAGDIAVVKTWSFHVV
jgi:hypothetical protein